MTIEQLENAIKILKPLTDLGFVVKTSPKDENFEYGSMIDIGHNKVESVDMWVTIDDLESGKVTCSDLLVEAFDDQWNSACDASTRW